ncbi:conidiophore development protein hymA [Coccidioides immitis RMSCC 3703]|uniref:Conidiophore development protein hymA n=1 Tax=Coccidioides immitis RMSCC 3703 TaxID=454286 RepID=A0A0J8QL16_COCIT|nr:conidiophore development protein hymA [Coccidioides immitis RMSCC 3703]
MAFLFSRNKSRQPAEIAKTLKDLLARLWQAPGSPKIEEDLAKHLAQIKLMVQGTQEVDSLPDQVHQLIQAFILDDLSTSWPEEILTRHKALVAGYLATNFDLFFSTYNNVLVLSDSYVTKRQSIKLLGELLLDRANYGVMTTYVDSGEHLKLCMNLLKDDRKMVQYEGFHIFKVRLHFLLSGPLTSSELLQVFVANPNKSVAVQRILINNRDRLLKFLPKFLEDRTDDDQFTDEKSFLVRQIEILPPEPVAPR